jgi:dTMP kinase
MDVQTIRDLNALATGGVLPDLTIVLDLDPTVGMARIGSRKHDAFERMDLAFHKRVREGYLEIARAEKNRVVVLKADQEKDALAADVARVADEFLARRELRHDA